MFTLEQSIGLEWVMPSGWMLPQPDLWYTFTGCRVSASLASETLSVTGALGEFLDDGGLVFPFPLSGVDFIVQRSGSLRWRAEVPEAAGFSPVSLVNSVSVPPLTGMAPSASGVTAMPGTIQEVLPLGLRVQYFPTLNPGLFPTDVSGITIASGSL